MNRKLMMIAGGVLLSAAIALFVTTSPFWHQARLRPMASYTVIVQATELERYLP
jgi:hypothetical protein